MGVEELHFDDFTDVTDLPGGDLTGWLDRGGNPQEWRTEEMARQLERLAADPHAHPSDVGAGKPSVVVVEEPFGRARPTVGPMIDLSLHLQLPLHVALARRLLREFVPPSGELLEAPSRGSAPTSRPTSKSAAASTRC